MASLIILKSAIGAMRKNNLKNSKMRKCRICNRNEGIVQIFKKSLDSNLAEDIQHFSGVTITRADKFSKLICKQCQDLLNKCILFRNLCNKTNKLLNETSKVVNTDNGPKNRYPERIYKWRCSYCPNMFPDLKSYYHHLPLCDKRYEASKNERKNFSSQLKNNPDKGGDSDHFEVDFKIPLVADDLFSDDSYSVPSPTFSDNDDGISCRSCQRYFCDTESYNRHLWYSKICKRYSNQPDKEKKSRGKPKALCEICGKIVSRPTILSHKRLHQNIFPYACDSCPYRGRSKNLLIVHLRSHMSVKPYKCTICSKTMSSTSNLAKHMESMHSGNKTFTCECPECGKAFRYVQSMKEHIANVHRNQTRVECDICFKNFRPRNLNDHRRNVHKIDTPKTGRPSNRLPSYIRCMMEESFVNEHDEPEHDGPDMSLENHEMEYQPI